MRNAFLSIFAQKSFTEPINLQGEGQQSRERTADGFLFRLVESKTPCIFLSIVWQDR